MNTRTLTISVPLLLSLLAIPAFSQLDTGTLSGRVSDASGAVVSNAQVTVVNTETNFTSDTTTNSSGIYRVSSLRPGPYRLTVIASGFKRSIRDGLDLHIAENLEINVALEVGGATESIVVTAEASQLQTETSAAGAVLEGTYLQQLPLYQRYVEASFFLLPNISIQGFGYTGNLQGFHIDGLPDNKIGYFQDGVYAVSANGGTLYTSQPIQTTVEEVKVMSSVLPAEYGHSGGGALSAVQRTGTNTLHGEISEFGRVSAMQHRKYFDLYRFGQQQPGQAATPSELFQQPNATLHGPVYIPKVYDGRNRTFFVFAVERVIEKQAKQQAYTVPDAQMLAGDFSFAGKGVTPNQLYDPLSTALVNGKYTRTPLAGNIIPASRIDPVAAKFIALQPYALPNAPGTYSNTGPSNNFQGTYLKKYFSENYTGRVDQQFSPSLKIYGNWLYKSIYQRSPNPQLSNPLFDSSLRLEYDYQNTATMGITRILSPTLINEARIGYNRFEAATTSPNTGKNTAALLGIPNVSSALLPNGLPLAVNGPNEQVLESFTVRDDMTWVKNKHSFKFGYDLLHSRQNNYNLGNPSGTFTFDSGAGLAGNCLANNLSGASTCPNTGIPNPNTTPATSSLAAFMLGSVSNASFSIPTASWLPRDNVNSFFFQDDWKFSPTLTLNLGVRWVMESPWHTKYGQFSQFDPTARDNVTSAFGVTTHPGGNITNREWQAPEPRIGLAWHPMDKLVVRTGFGMQHLDLGLAPSQLDDYSISANQTQPSGDPTPLYQISRGPNAIVYPNATGGIQPYSGCTTGTLNGVTLPTCSGRNTAYTNPNLKNPYSMTWNLALQYQLSRNVLVELSYDGSSAVGLIETPNTNVLPEDFGAGNNTLLAALVGNSQVYRPYTNFANISYRLNAAHST